MLNDNNHNQNPGAAMDEMFKLIHEELRIRNIKFQPFAPLRGMLQWRKREPMIGTLPKGVTNKRATLGS